MATIPATIRIIIENLLDQITDGDCTEVLTSVEYNGFRWKLTIKKSQENEISLLIRRQKRN